MTPSNLLFNLKSYFMDTIPLWLCLFVSCSISNLDYTSTFNIIIYPCFMIHSGYHPTSTVCPFGFTTFTLAQLWFLTVSNNVLIIPSPSLGLLTKYPIYWVPTTLSHFSPFNFNVISAPYSLNPPTAPPHHHLQSPPLFHLLLMTDSLHKSWLDLDTPWSMHGNHYCYLSAPHPCLSIKHLPITLSGWPPHAMTYPCRKLMIVPTFVS